MFSLIKSIEPSNGLAQVEELIGHQPDIKYTHMQYDEKSSQYIGAIETIPKYFTTNGYMEYLYDNITKFKFVDNCAIYEMVNIPMSKVIKPVTIEELQEKIQHLEQIIASLPKQDELIETHIYPSWDTYEDFKKLPSWKYFDASENSANYILYDEKNGQLGKLREKYEDMWVRIRHNNDDHIRDQINYSYIKYTGVNNWSFYIPKKEVCMDSIDFNYYNKWGCGDINFPSLFHRNLKIYNFKHIIAYPIYLYITNYIIGWFLLNWRQYVGYDIYIGIEITDKVKINIFKKQNNIIGIDSITYGIKINLPTIQSVKINGIQYHS
jgi:hypothetical protein